jgi:ubiquinone/menaquinone biosynthesis C-methylase UbiE
MVSYTPEQIRDRYCKVASKYDLLDALPEIFGLKRVRKNLFRKAKGNVLEVAAGTGKNFFSYDTSIRFTAIDVSPDMLAIAERKAGKYKLNAQFKVMDAHSLDFPNNSFDTITSSLSMCTFTDPAKAIEEIVRVCKPSGRILLLEHGRSSRNGINKWLDKNEAAHAEKLGCHWNKDIYQILSQTSLRILHHTDYLFSMFHSIEAEPKK